MIGNVLVGVAMLIGLAGVVVPLLPGTALILGAGFVWAIFLDDRAGRWAVVTVMTVLFVLGIVAKYALPARPLSGRVPTSTLVLAAAGGVIGFFVLPPLGLLIGGLLGVYLDEVRRTG